MMKNTEKQTVQQTLIIESPKVKKGESCYLVGFHQGADIHRRDFETGKTVLNLETLDGVFCAQEVTIQSFGKKQGTATRNDNGYFINVRINVETQIIVRTKKEIEALPTRFAKELKEYGEQFKLQVLERSEKWLAQYGEQASAKVLKKHNEEMEAVKNHEIGSAKIRCY